MTNAPLRARPARVAPAIVVALVLIALGAALVVLAILRLQSGEWPAVASAVSDAGTRLWGARSVAAAAGVLAVVGLVLVLCAALPGRPSSRQSHLVGSVESVVTRRGTERLVEHRIRAVDGVGSCRARLRGNGLQLVVGTPLREHHDLTNAVTATADDVLHTNLDGRIPRTMVRMVSSS